MDKGAETDGVLTGGEEKQSFAPDVVLCGSDCTNVAWDLKK